VTDLVRHMLGREAAKCFFTEPIRKVAKINVGGLGWSHERFDLVDWEGLRDGLTGRPAMFGIWLAKQTIGVNATRKNVGRIMKETDQLCPNCRSYREDSAHLNRCMEAGRSMLFKESVHRLGIWMESSGCTDPDLAYWIKKFLLIRGRRPCSTLRNMPPIIASIAADIDSIGWTEFLHGRIPKSVTDLQTAHCLGLVRCHLTGRDWTRGFIRQLLRISHSQRIYRNFTLHHKTRGYLALKKKAAVLHEIAELTEKRPEDLPEDCRFLLEMDLESLVLALYERQAYWVLAMQAAVRSGIRNSPRTWKRVNQQGDSVNRTRRLEMVEYSRVERENPRVGPGDSRRRPRPHGGTEIENGSNKRLRKPD